MLAAIDLGSNSFRMHIGHFDGEQIRILSPGGGFVFQQVHNIMADVPPENVVAMFEAARGTG